MGTRGRKKGSTLKSKPTIAPTTDKTETISTRSMMTRRSQTRATEKPTDDLKDSKAAEIEPSRKRVRKTVEKKIEEEEEIVALHDSDDQQMDDNDDQQEVELIRPQVKLEEAKKNEEEELKQVEETARDDQNVGVQTTTIKLVDPPPAEVFTEASLIAEVNQHLLQSSAPNVLTNPLSQDTSSDSSDSEDAETDDYNDDSGSGSKKSRPRAANGTHRGGTANGVLNKSKIDTEFIAKLIPNKDPNDKRYDLNEINKLRLLSHSYQNFSVKLLTRLFDEEEIIGRNVYGRNYSGDKSATKQPLDPERINFIKETVLRLTKTNNPELAWASCVIAMNRKMVDINNKYAKLKTDRNS